MGNLEVDYLGVHCEAFSSFNEEGVPVNVYTITNASADRRAVCYEGGRLLSIASAREMIEETLKRWAANQ